MPAEKRLKSSSTHCTCSVEQMSKLETDTCLFDYRSSCLPCHNEKALATTDLALFEDSSGSTPESVRENSGDLMHAEEI
jgi:hypothetical protein